jgi:hypothetical protein
VPEERDDQLRRAAEIAERLDERSSGDPPERRVAEALEEAERAHARDRRAAERESET